MTFTFVMWSIASVIWCGSTLFSVWNKMYGFAIGYSIVTALNIFAAWANYAT